MKNMKNKVSLQGQIIIVNGRYYSLNEFQRPKNIIMCIPPMLNMSIDVEKVKMGTRVKLK